MYLFVLLFSLCALLLFIYIKHTMSYWKRRSIPHDPPDYLNGNIKNWRGTRKSLVDILTPLYRKYKEQFPKLPFVGFYFLQRHAVVALNMNFVKSVLIKDFNLFHERGLFFNERDDPLSGHMFRLGGSKWRPLRQKLSPTFSSGKMKCMFPLVADIAQEMQHVLAEKLAEKPERSAVMELTDLMGRFTADVIGSCAFGLNCNSLRDAEAEFAVMGRRAFMDRRNGRIATYIIENYPELAIKLKMKNTPQHIHDFYFRIVSETIRQRREQNVKRNDFMNLLIELLERQEITIEEIVAQAYIFFIAGFDTSSQTMGFALYELAKHPEIQNQLRADINAALKRHNGEFSYESMAEMDYLERVVAETLRKYPILPQLIRQAQARYEPEGFDKRYYLDKGTMVYIPVHAIHYDEEFYPEPEKFDPDRFLPEAIQQRPACTWLPFGDGPRNCIGLRFGKMQAYIGLYYLLKHFKFSIAPETEIPLKFHMSSTLLCPLNGIYLHVEQIE